MPGLMLGHCCQRFYGIRRDAEIAKIIRRSKDQPTLIQHRQMNVGIAETFDHAICTVLRRRLLHINGRCKKNGLGIVIDLDQFDDCLHRKGSETRGNTRGKKLGIANGG